MASTFKEKLAGWGNYPVIESFTLSPRNEEDVRDDINVGPLVPRGLGRSYGDQAVNDGRFVAICTKLNHFLNFDEKEGILECEAGVSLEEIITVFGPKGWLPMICPGTKFVTIGGAIANDIHGKAHHIDGSFVNCVISFTILLADGTVLEASRTENSDLFWANFGGLGLLGVILKAKLNDLPAKLKADPLKIHSTGKLAVPFFLPSFALNGLTVRLLNRVIAFVQNSPKDFVHYEKFFFPLDAINNWNKGYGKRGFIQYQFVIPEENGKQHLTEILEMIAASGCTPFLNVFKRMGDGQGILSFPFKGYTLAIDFPVTKNLLTFTPKLDAKVLAAGGRLYLGKDALLHEDMFKAMYPQYEQWLTIKRKYDPEEKFSSNISRRLGLHN